MEAGVVRFRLVDNPSEKKAEFYDVYSSKKHFGPSPLDIQTRFLKALHADGFEPFDRDADGYQYWRRPTQPTTVAE